MGDRTPEWANDGRGFELEATVSADWWPARWCSFYACELFQGTCTGRFCPLLCGGNTPRMPLCFSLLLCGLYPLLVCPMTCVLRRAVVHQRKIHESALHTCLATACCLPCSLAQMANESSEAKKKGIIRDEAMLLDPTTTNSMLRDNDEDDANNESYF